MILAAQLRPWLMEGPRQQTVRRILAVSTRPGRDLAGMGDAAVTDQLGTALFVQFLKHGSTW